MNGTGSKIMAAQGAGALSRGIKTRSAWSETDFRLHGKLHVSISYLIITCRRGYYVLLFIKHSRFYKSLLKI